jgi:hypothetical protein
MWKKDSTLAELGGSVFAIERVDSLQICSEKKKD